MKSGSARSLALLFAAFTLMACGDSHDDCSNGFHEGGDGTCVADGTCSAGHHDAGNGVCVRDEGECPPGLVASGKTGLCCADGYRDGGDEVCVRDGICSPGYLENNAGTCEKTSCAPRDMTASTSRLDVVRLWWTAPICESKPIRYRVLRNGDPIAEIGPGVLTYDDATAPAGEIVVDDITLTASEDNPAGVELTWSSPLSSIEGASATYAVEAIYADASRKRSAGVQGNRAPPPEPPIAYELSREEGAWNGIGEATNYLDEAAPMGELAVLDSPTARADPTRGVIELELELKEESVSIETPAAEVGYQVRAKIEAGPTKISNTATGRRHSRTSPVTVRWERSAEPGSGVFEELPDATGMSCFDPLPVVGEEHGYRAVLSSPGAIGRTPETRATLPAMVHIAAGDYHTCGIRDDGKVICWGSNDEGQAPTDASTESFQAITAGGHHTCGLRDDGEVLCWGLNDKGQCRAPTNASFQTIAAGGHHTCGTLRDGGKAVCWGGNRDGQAPTEASARSFRVVAAGRDHTCGILRDDGKVLCWGNHYIGQGQTTTGGSFQAIAAGTDHTCGILDDGKVLCWLSGSGAEVPSDASDAYFRAISMGTEHTCGILDDGGGICWGSNSYGQRWAPADASFRAIAAGGYHTCGILNDGKVICWGWNHYGQAPRP